MPENLTQEQRLEYLVTAFLKDAGYDERTKIPADTESRRRILRSLMNVRMPAPLPDDVLRIQDEYLQGRAAEKGLVFPEDLPMIRDGISLWQGDITRLAADAIVNAANSRMLGCFTPMHTCIDNCIHTFAGIQLRAACAAQMAQLRRIHGSTYEQPTAVPMLTDGYNLPAKKVVHIVGPIVSGHLTEELEQDLSDCYRKTLDTCRENGLATVAFCCISTGVFRFPKRRAAQIAVKTVTEWLAAAPGAVDRVIFNIFKDEDKMYYEQELL